jgi:hypothetical protein
MLVHATTAWSSTCATVPLTASNRFQLLLLQELAASTDSSSTRKFFGLIFPHQDHLLKIHYSIITYICVCVQITLLIPKNTSNDQSHNWCAAEIIDIQHRACRSCLASERKTKLRAVTQITMTQLQRWTRQSVYTFVLWHINAILAPLVCSRIESAVSSACIAMPQISAVPQRRSELPPSAKRRVRFGIWGIRMYVEMNSVYKSHTVRNMRNTYVHGNEQHI